MNETAHRFGRAHHLVGIAGTPATPAAPVGVIVLNAGLVQRVGPFRLHVGLTRHLNACGYPTLRFDLSGLGDSGVDGSPRTRQEQVAADVTDAMQLLTSQSRCTRFVLIGLCSGAAHAHAMARTHPQVAGVVFLDGYAYRTPGFWMRHYLRKLVRTSPIRLLKALFNRVRRAGQAHDPVFEVGFPPRAEVAADLKDMLGRGLQLLFVFSGGASGYFNHARQFRECFGALACDPGVAVHYFVAADHTYVLGKDRAALTGIVAAWLRGRFPA